MALPPLQNAALVVIDVQAGLFDSRPGPLDGAGVIERINALAAQARQAGRPVVFVQHENERDGVAPGSAAWQLHPALQVEPADLRLSKNTCDAFCQTALEEQMRQLGVTTLVLTGYATDFCIDSTLRNAVSKGFEVVVAQDAHTTSDGPMLPADQVRRHHNWAWGECTAVKPVRVVPAAEIRFAAS